MPVASESVLEALRSVQGPELHRSLVDLGMIRNLEVDEQGTVTFTLDKAEMVGVKNIHGGVSSPTQQSCPKRTASSKVGSFSKLPATFNHQGSSFLRKPDNICFICVNSASRVATRASSR
jgi:hypothetical protein